MNENDFLDVEKAATYINRTPGALRALTQRRRIPFRKPGGRLMFVREELDAWILTAPGMTLDEHKASRN